MITTILTLFQTSVWARRAVAVLVSLAAVFAWDAIRSERIRDEGRQEVVQESVETARGKAGEIRDEISRSRPDGALERMRKSGACRDC